MTGRIIITASAIAKVLRVSSKTVYRLAQTEGLPVYRHGSGKTSPLCIDTAELEQWRAARRSEVRSCPKLS